MHYIKEKLNDIEKEFQFIKLQFINKYKCKRINNPSKIDYWKIFAKNDTRIALNILYTSKKMEAFIQLIFQKLIQIVKKKYSNDSKWRRKRLALSYSKKNICIAKRNIFKAWWWLLFLALPSFFRTKNKKVCKIKYFCETLMPSEKDNILELINIWNQIKYPTLFMLTLNL